MNKKGFTLIELLAVVIILGVIMTIAVPNVLSMLDRNKRNTFVENAKTMVNQAEYTIRKDTSIDLPEKNGEAILLTLEYLNTNDVSESPYNTSYSPSNSFVVVVNKTDTIKDVDINGDGKTDENDVEYLNRYLAGWSGYELTADQIKRADLNGDGKVNGKDILLLKDYMSKDNITRYDYYVHLVACSDLDCANTEENSVNKNRGINLVLSTSLSGGKRFGLVEQGSSVKTTLGMIDSSGLLTNEVDIKAITGATSIKVFNKLS